jgi:hypothetical protein
MAKAKKKRAPKAQARNAPNASQLEYEAGRREALARIARMLRLCSIGVYYSDALGWLSIPAYSATGTDSLRALFDPPGDYFDRAERALAFIVADERDGYAECWLRQLMRRVSIAGAAGDAPTMEIVARALRIVRDMGGSAAAEWEAESPFGLPDLERAFTGRGLVAGRFDEYGLRFALRTMTPDERGEDPDAVGVAEDGVDALCVIILKVMAAPGAERLEQLEIVDRVCERRPNTDRSTVRRRLKLLVKRGLLVKGHGRKGRYALTVDGRKWVHANLDRKGGA